MQMGVVVVVVNRFE